MAQKREEQTLLGRSNEPSIMSSRNNSTEPVKLTPSWEARNDLPEDELNFRNMTMERVKMELEPPIDRFKIIFFILILHGIGTLTPWNMFITAKDYFVNYKLSPNYTGTNNTDYAANFMPYLTFASQIPNVLFNWMNIFVNLGGDLTKRIVWSLIIEIILFLITVILAMVDSSQWPGTFFWTTMVSVILLNIFAGIFQNTVYGMAAKLPSKYTGAVVLGSNISGTFATIMSIASSFIWSSVRKAAIYYFITAIFVILICFDTFFALPLNKFYRYHELQSEKQREKSIRSNITIKPPYWRIFKESFPQLFNVFMIFFVTLSVFPTVHSDIKHNSDGFLFGIISKENFSLVTCFLTFNVFAMLGSLTTSWIKWPSPKYLVWPVMLRILFIPLFLLCNYQPYAGTRTLPVYITNDYIYWMIAIIMSYSSGYLSSLAMMYTPLSQSNPMYQVKAGMMAAAMLISGIFAGIMFSFLPSIIVQLNFLKAQEKS